MVDSHSGNLIQLHLCRINLTAMKLLLLFVVAFQVLCVICQDDYYDYSDDNDVSCTTSHHHEPRPTTNTTCSQCSAEAGEVCHCQVVNNDLEWNPVNELNKVRASLKKKKCWEKNQSDDTRFYEMCENDALDADAANECLLEDRIEICYKNDIDAAQALCRQFNKGDAYSVTRSTSRKLKKRHRITRGRRVWLATLNCKPHARGLGNCSLEYLDHSVQTCDQMVAHCYFSACWQPQWVIRARVSGGGVRYGQACKSDRFQQTAGVCQHGCFLCPGNWVRAGSGRSSLNGNMCFQELGNTPFEELDWQS